MKESQTTYKTYSRLSEKRNRGSKDLPNFKKAETQLAKPSHFLSVLLSSHSIFHGFFFHLWKIANKCLNAALTSISEAPVDSSPVSEISYANTREDVDVSLNLN